MAQFASPRPRHASLTDSFVSLPSVETEHRRSGAATILRRFWPLMALPPFLVLAAAQWLILSKVIHFQWLKDFLLWLRGLTQ